MQGSSGMIIEDKVLFDNKIIGLRKSRLNNTPLLSTLAMLAKIGIKPRNTGIDQFSCIFPVKLLLKK